MPPVRVGTRGERHRHGGDAMSLFSGLIRGDEAGDPDAEDGPRIVRYRVPADRMAR